MGGTARFLVLWLRLRFFYKKPVCPVSPCLNEAEVLTERKFDPRGIRSFFSFGFPRVLMLTSGRW